jgi:hypothetical protein
MDSTEKHVVKQNMVKLKKNSEDQSSVELRNMEINLLLEEKNK